MIEFKNKSFPGLFDRGSTLLLENMRFEACEFINCAISLTDQLDRIATVRNVVMENCSVVGCHTGPMVLSNVSIKNLKTNDLFIIWSPYLNRVVIEGNIGKMKINQLADPFFLGSPKQKPFDDFREKFYSSVEWALDISNAHFREFDMLGVPARLVKRDPESQIVITRERALKVAVPGWESCLDPSNKLWPFMVKLFLSDGDADTVFVAPLGAAKAKRDLLLKNLNELRALGLAEPD